MIVAGALVALPTGASAQTGSSSGAVAGLDSIFGYWESRYDSAMAAYAAGYESTYGKNGLEEQWEDVLVQLGSLGGSGEDRRRGNLEARAKDLSDRIHRAENELHALKDQWCRAREGFAEAIDARLELMGDREDAGGPSAEYVELNRRLVEIESEAGAAFGSCDLQALQPFPGVSVLPGDGPAELLAKARFLESKRKRHEQALADLDRQIDRLRRQQDRDGILRALEDHTANEARFGRNQPPVEDEVSGGATNEGGFQNTATALSGPSIEERLENLLAFREEVAKRVRDLEEKEREFIARAGGSS